MSEIIAFGKSDIGLKRSNNEDIFLVDSERGFVCVADGVGGVAAGEVASQVFADTANKTFKSAVVQSDEEALEILKDVFRLSNEWIFQKAKDNPDYKGMGCTAELLLFYNGKYLLGHVGDSRTYLFRQGKLRQLTRDHSLVQYQIDQGMITKSEASKHALRNVILKAVGFSELLEVDFIRGKSIAGDLFLLCSDGLTDMIPDTSIEDTLSMHLDINKKIDSLIDLAKSAGGRDNITVVLCEVSAKG